MRKAITAALLLSTLSGVGAVHAQDRFALELRGGVAVPTGDLGTADLDVGGGFGLTGSVRFMPHMLAYAGWDWNRLAFDAPSGIDRHVEDTGYTFGLQFQHPLLSTIGGYVRAGGVYRHIELESVKGNVVEDGDLELGWEAGGGFVVPITARLALTPGARYRMFSVDSDVFGVGSTDLSYVMIDVGLQYRFGGGSMMTALRR